MSDGSQTLRVLESWSAAGGAGANEDLVGWSGDRCWVVDGATPVTPNLIDRRSDARWLVEQVDEILRDQSTATALSQNIASGVESIAAAIAVRLSRLDFPESALPPACSLGLAQLNSERLEIAIAGDVSIYLPRSGTLLHDPRFGGREKSSRTRHQGVALNSKLVQKDIADRRWRYIDGPGDMFILSRNTRISKGVLERTVRTFDGEEVLLMSDGFARLVESYGIFGDYSSLMAFVREHGLSGAYSLLRQHEVSNESDSNFKRSDDASAIHAVVERI